TVSPIRPRGDRLDLAGSALLQEIEDELQRQLVRIVFAGGDRDVEALGLAHAVPPAPVTVEPLDPQRAHEFACSVLRLLARRRRLPLFSEYNNDWPRQVRTYADSVARVNGTGVDGAFLLEQLGQQLGVGPSTGYRVDPRTLCLTLVRQPSMCRCQTCRTKHLHRSAGVCITCHEELRRQPEVSDPARRDYYAWLATEEGGVYRLHCEELTGQTDPLEGQARQARF